MSRRKRPSVRSLCKEVLEARHLLTAEIEGFVWNDWTRDGHRGKPDQEYRVADVTVKLLNERLELVDSTETDEEGVYEFSNAAAGRYVLEFVAPDDTVFTQPFLATNTKDSDVDPKTGRTTAFTIDDGDKLDDIDAGIVAPTGSSNVVGRVWDDIDADGILDAKERGIANAEVQLENKHGKKLLEVNTDENGWYFIDGGSILPGEYIVDFVRPDTPDPAYEISPKHIDQIEGASRADQENGKTDVFSITASQQDGERENISLSAGFFRAATVSGFVWHDRNRDSMGKFRVRPDQVVNESGEFGVEDVRVRLLDETGREVNRSKTDRYGRYTLAVPTPGSYQVEFETGDGIKFSKKMGSSSADPTSGRTELLTINALEQVGNISAGVYSDVGTQMLRGRVWHDIDADGFQDPDETGVANAEVQLENGSLVRLLEVTTNGAGEFVFDGRLLLPGEYHLDFKRPNRSESQGKWQISPRNEDATDLSLDNDAQPTNGKTSPIQLTAHLAGRQRESIDQDAAFFQFARVTGKAWDDQNRNGVLDPGESVIPGVEVELLDEGQQTVTTALTNPSGEYIIEKVIPGTEYRVQFTAPENTVIASTAVDPELQIDSLTGRSEAFVPKSDEVLRAGAGLYGATNATELTGIAWDDIDGDGVQGVGEAGRANVEVRLRDIRDRRVSSTMTGPDGAYRFANLSPGGYKLEFIPPDNTTISPMHRGIDGSRDSDVNRFTRRTATIPIVGSQIESSFDVGIYSGPISDQVQETLRITEVGFIGHGNAEFLEVKNIGSEPIDLTGTAFTSGIRFDFSDSETKSLFPNEHAVIVGNRALLPDRENGLGNRFSLASINVAGVYNGDLNREENITLLDGNEDVVTSFRYDDDWFIIMDDEYQAWTLTVVDETADVTEWDNRSNWRPSSFLAGTPGVDDPKTTPDPGAIVINEVLTQSADGFNDLIEIHNTTDADIDIGYWYLGDSGKRGEVEPLIKRTRYRIAPGTIVPAKGYVVFSREEHFGNTADPGLNYPFGLSSFGEAVHIIAADKYGHMQGYSDSVSFPSADRDMAFGRHLLSDGTATFTVMSEPSFGKVNPAPSVGPVVIDAIAFHVDEDADEFVRLFNPSENDVELGFPGGQWKFGDGIEYRFSDEALIKSGQRAFVVEIEPTDFREKYEVPADVPIFGPYDGSLSNAGEAISLFRPGADGRALLVDRVTYDNQQPWPVSDQNSTLLRKRHDIVGDEPANWVLAGELTTGVSADGLYRRQFMQTEAAQFFDHDALGQYAFQADPGDSNGDGRFDSTDLVTVFREGKYNTGNPANWNQGDWNADGLFDSGDLVVAFMQGHYERDNRAAVAAAVGELDDSHPWKGNRPLSEDLVDEVFA